MTNHMSTIWNNKSIAQLAKALIAIEDNTTMQAFLSDIMTEKEITEISARLEAARMLKAGNTYTDIILRTKLSSRTVARISDWIKNGNGGYAAVLNKTTHHNHIPPARAV